MHSPKVGKGAERRPRYTSFPNLRGTKVLRFTQCYTIGVTEQMTLVKCIGAEQEQSAVSAECSHGPKAWII